MRNKTIAILLSICIAGCIALSGCQKETQQKADFSGYKAIADLATVECYYHNVAEYIDDGTDLLFGAINVGYKKAWFEYRGSITMGVDVSKVIISDPSEDGTVFLSVPEATVLGIPKVDIESFSPIYLHSGAFQTLTLSEKTKALSSAQEKMKESAENDASLTKQARERAQLLLKEYIVNVGKAIGQEYTVVYADAA